jgi:hypothetical protein
MHMPRVTVYVPDELKGRMDAAGEAVNWSAVAQTAFSEAVAVHNLRKDPANMDELVERLRASKERVTERDRATGEESGKAWATRTAEIDELERINADYPNIWTLDHLCQAIDPHEEMDQYAWTDFFEGFGFAGGVQPPDDWAQGFASGAVDVYRSVADKL